jgi:MFS family permease
MLLPLTINLDVLLNIVMSGAIIGQVLVGIVCDRLGRTVALMATTAFIVIGGTLSTAAYGIHGSVPGLFWFLTIARGITGVVGHPYRT